jgi:hypothetical protein
MFEFFTGAVGTQHCYFSCGCPVLNVVSLSLAIRTFMCPLYCHYQWWETEQKTLDGLQWQNIHTNVVKIYQGFVKVKYANGEA